MTNPTPAKPVTKRVRSQKRKPTQRKPSHGEIAERAYFLHLENGAHDQFANWLRAERELTAA
jgi:hypothetical protein